MIKPVSLWRFNESFCFFLSCSAVAALAISFVADPKAWDLVSSQTILSHKFFCTSDGAFSATLLSYWF